MPRLTDSHYLELHHRLAHTWAEHRQVFALVSPAEQWLLHDFFVPSWSMTDEELVAFRKRVALERPGLPASASRAASRMNARLLALQAGDRSADVEARGRKGIQVYAAVQPAIDPDAVGRALTQMVTAPARS